jgi:hypothetical protein
MISRSNKGSKLNFCIDTSFGNQHQSRSLPEVVGKDGQTRPDRVPAEPLASTRPKPNLRLSIVIEASCRNEIVAIAENHLVL